MQKKSIEIVSGLGMGGAEKAFLNRLGWAPARTDILVINTRPELSDWKLPSHIPVVNCRRQSLIFLWRLHSQIRNHNPDSVTVRSPVDLVAAGVLKFVNRGRWKLVFESHSTHISSSRFKTKLLIPLVRFALSQTNLVIAVSTAVAEGSQCQGAKKIEVCFQGANVELKLDRDREFIFLFVGRLIDLKQPFLFLRALRRVRHLFIAYGARAKIVGRGPLTSAIAEFIESNQLQDIVELTGYSQDLDTIYSESEYLVSTSRFEGLPLTFFEAKQHGLRIITTPSSGDFDILGSEDVILPDFQESSLIAALDHAVRFGQSAADERRSIQEKNQWMQSKTCAIKYYDLVNSELNSQS